MYNLRLAWALKVLWFGLWWFVLVCGVLWCGLWCFVVFSATPMDHRGSCPASEKLMFPFFLALYNGSQVSIVALWATCLFSPM